MELDLTKEELYTIKIALFFYLKDLINYSECEADAEWTKKCRQTIDSINDKIDKQSIGGHYEELKCFK